MILRVSDIIIAEIFQKQILIYYNLELPKNHEFAYRAIVEVMLNQCPNGRLNWTYALKTCILNQKKKLNGVSQLFVSAFLTFKR